MKFTPKIERYFDYEKLDWIISHGIGVDHTADMTAFSQTLAQVGALKGIETYYYMRYDDSPERNYIPMIFYTVFGNPNVPVLLHEEVEPVGELFNVIAVFSSSLLLQKTSQRALLFDGAKKNAILVVNTSISPDDVVKLVKKYNLAQDWFGRVVTISAARIDSAIAYPMLGAVASAWDRVDLDSLLAAADIFGKEKKKESIRKGYENSSVKEVHILAEETEMFKKIKNEIELPEYTGEFWTPEVYYTYQKAAAEAQTYSSRIASMPRWEVLAPGLIEFGPKPGNKNIGFTTQWRWQRPIIDYKRCTDCKLCHYYCPDGAISFNPIKIDYDYCKGCGICANVCPTKAISMVSELEHLEGLKDREVLRRFDQREYGF
ncbi:4Fe-4S binding protein [Fervidicoccus fontis]|nr:4Fe-4S binding protein [Fervidicoccus fontis]